MIKIKINKKFINESKLLQALQDGAKYFGKEFDISSFKDVAPEQSEPIEDKLPQTEEEKREFQENMQQNPSFAKKILDKVIKNSLPFAFILSTMAPVYLYKLYKDYEETKYDNKPFIVYMPRNQFNKRPFAMEVNKEQFMSYVASLKDIPYKDRQVLMSNKEYRNLLKRYNFYIQKEQIDGAVKNPTVNSETSPLYIKEHSRRKGDWDYS